MAKVISTGKVTLELTQKEASAIKALVGRVTGGGVTDGVWDALDEAGVPDRFAAGNNASLSAYILTEVDE